MIEVFLNDEPWAGTTSFYIVDLNEGTGKRYIYQFGKHNVTLLELKEYAENPNPTFTLTSRKTHELLKSFAEKAADQGIKTKDDHYREGESKALKAHLEDMRKLVFKEHQSEPREEKK